MFERIYIVNSIYEGVVQISVNKAREESNRSGRISNMRGICDGKFRQARNKVCRMPEGKVNTNLYDLQKRFIYQKIV